MSLILLYSFLLITGIFASQSSLLDATRPPLETLTMLCLSYIMVEVGLEFTFQKNKGQEYVKDFCIASTAAILPWLFCAIYFAALFHLGWKQAALIGLAAAPTSAGVLFAMLSAAGLSATWVFKKARILAVADDLATILLMVPLQIALIGMRPELIFVIFIIIFLLVAAFQWLNRLHWPVGKVWLFFYGTLIVAILTILERTTHIHLAALLPAFSFGCVLYNPHHFQKKNEESAHARIPEPGWSIIFDRFVKGTFMFLVGFSLPKIEMNNLTIGMIVFHVIMLTLLSNLGKCFPAFCYRNEASIKSRMALSIAMFPRGEVGAGVLLVAISYGFAGVAASLAVLSLALNLLLTGFFVFAVFKLLPQEASHQ